MNRQIAGWIAHRWAKWVTLIVSLIFIAVMGSMAAKLTGIQENDIGSWLPGDAESTKVINKSEAFSDPNSAPAVVLYVRDSGITPADLAKATSDAAASCRATTSRTGDPDARMGCLDLPMGCLDAPLGCPGAPMGAR